MTQQLSFTDILFWSNGKRKRSKTHEKLTQIKNILDWELLTKIMFPLKQTHSSKGGRPQIDLSIKIKMLFLQSLYGMSDELLEDWLLSNLDFQEFVGLSVSASVPDFTTFWRFKESVIKNQLLEKLWAEVNKQLNAKNIKLERGQLSIIDATIIRSSNQVLSNEKRENLKQNPSSQIDTEAKSTEKNGKKYF